MSVAINTMNFRLREEAEQKRRNLEAEREELLGRKSGVIDLLQDMQAKHDTIKVGLAIFMIIFCSFVLFKFKFMKTVISLCCTFDD